MLAQSIGFAQLAGELPEAIPWPRRDPAGWEQLIRAACLEELEIDLEAIRQRQQNYLRRELDRIDDYFESYERELNQRLQRQQHGQAKIKGADRLAATKSEHQRRRLDQVQRHEIRVIPHLDALILLAEPAWKASVTTFQHNEGQRCDAMFVPRARRWVV